MQFALRTDSGEDDVVNGNEDELDEIPNDAHHDETHHECLKNLHVFLVVWLFALLVEVGRVLEESCHLPGDVLLFFLVSSS